MNLKLLLLSRIKKKRFFETTRHQIYKWIIKIKVCRTQLFVYGTISLHVALIVDSGTSASEVANLQAAGNSCLVCGTISLYVALIVDSATPVTSPTSAINKKLNSQVTYVFKIAIGKLALVIISLLIKHS